jgi:hypothetical protein
VDGQRGDSNDTIAGNKLEVVKSSEAPSAATALVDTWETLENAVSKT